MMKKGLIALVLLCGLLTGCGSGTSQESAPAEDATEAQTVSTVSGTIYYATDHGTVDTAQISNFSARLEEIGYTWRADLLRAVPAAPDTVLVLNSPTEDLTPGEVDTVNALLDEGGSLLLFLPASDAPLRYKYLERVLEDYYIQIDYDVLSETDERRTMKDDPTCLRMEIAGAPEYMPTSDKEMSLPPYMRNVRSFRFFVGEGAYEYDAVKHDAMIETAASAVGTPCGGQVEDPEVFENETMAVMLYARNDRRRNSSVVAVGSSDFLLDEKWSAPESPAIRTWVLSAVYWLACVYN